MGKSMMYSGVGFFQEFSLVITEMGRCPKIVDKDCSLE